jgi:hypothetical protein
VFQLDVVPKPKRYKMHDSTLCKLRYDVMHQQKLEERGVAEFKLGLELLIRLRVVQVKTKVKVVTTCKRKHGFIFIFSFAKFFCISYYHAYWYA